LRVGETRAVDQDLVVGEVEPWYHQFYVRRGSADWVSDQISVDGYERGLEAIDGFAFVGTTMYGSPTAFTARVYADAPGAPNVDADRVAEARLGGAGPVAIVNWEPGDEPVAIVPVPAGPVQVRVSWFGIREAAAHPDCEVGGRRPSPEHLTLEFWPLGP
jgi:hypothetical protein